MLFTVASMELKRSWEVDCHLLQGVSALQLSTEDDVGVEAPFLRLLVLDFFFSPFPLHSPLPNTIFVSAKLLGWLELSSDFNFLGHAINSQVV